VPEHLIRNPRGTNWGSLREGLRDRLARGPEMNMKDEFGLGLAIHWVQQALISASDDNCPLRPVKTGRQSLKWSSELESPRTGVRRPFNNSQKDKNSHRWELYIQGVSRLVDITAGGDFLGLSDQKSSYKHMSNFGRLRSYGHFLIPVHALV